MGKKNIADEGRKAYGQLRDYPTAALYLASSYGNMLKEKAYIEKVLSGEYLYTEDDALMELISTTAAAELDTGVRVQASNISNTTERIGLLLAGGFVERRNREIFREVMEDKEGQAYLYWKLDVVETAMRERMDSMERAVFKRLFVKHMTYKQIREACKKDKLFDRSINDRRRSALLMIEREIRLREGAFEDGKMYTDRLMQECSVQESEVRECRNH